MDMTIKQTGIDEVLAKYDIKSLDEAKKICLDAGINVEEIVKGIQPICFDNAVKAYELGVAIAIKTNTTKACDVALKLGEGLQAYCVKGSVADERQIGLGHGRLGSMLLKEETKVSVSLLAMKALLQLKVLLVLLHLPIRFEKLL